MRKIFTIMILTFAFCMNAEAAPVVFKGTDYCSVTGLDTAGGKLYMSVTQGVFGGKSQISALISSNAGKSFSDPVMTIAHESLSVSNGILWTDASGTLWLFYTETEGYFDGRGTLKAIRCSDPSAAMPVWSEPSELGFGVCTGKPIQVDERIVLPFALWSRTQISAWPNLYGNLRKDGDRGQYSELDSYRGAGIYVSDDMGASWKCFPDVVETPAKVDARYPDPQLTVSSDGIISMYLRSNGTGEAYVSESADKGLTWSKAEPFIINPDRKIAFDNMGDGRLLMARSNAFDQFANSLNQGLFAYVSDDSGKSWYGNMVIDMDPWALDPVLEVADGRSFVAYTKYVKGRKTICLTSITDKDIIMSIPQQYMLKSIEVAAAEFSDIPSKKGNRKWCPETVKVGSYNIQVSRAAAWDPRADWTRRLPAVTALIDEYDFDILCGQEPYLGQIQDLREHYKDKYECVARSTAADSLNPLAAHNPIFYKKDRFELIEWGIEWYTAKPGTTGFDAATPRNMTWAHLRDKKSSKEFFCISSHFDHKGKEAKCMSSYILLDVIKRLSGSLPVIVCGDFNSPDRSDPYNILVNSGMLADSYVTCSEPVNGEYATCPGYKPKDQIPKNKNHIDHIFYTPDNSMILYWECIINDYDGVYGSDHLPLFVEWKFSN